jgi:hypothetical protein
MTTRADLRADLRLRLEDAGPAYLWSDAMLNAAIADAIRRYGGIVPQEATGSVAASSGDRRLAFTPGTIDPARIVRVRDPDGHPVPRWRDDDLPADRAQGWRWWNDGLDLAMPAAGGAWSVDHRTGRQPPADDAASAAILPGDEPAVLGLALAVALERRAAEEAKRGAAPFADTLMAMAATARRDAETALDRRRARAAG